MILFTSSANDHIFSPSNKTTYIIGGERPVKVGGQELTLGRGSQWVPWAKRAKPVVGPEKPPEADDTFIVKICYFVTSGI